MRRWLIVTLAAVAVVCLLVGLCPQQAVPAVHSQPFLAFGARPLHPFVEPTQASPTAALAVRGPPLGQARAELLASLADQRVLLTERDVRPPSLDTRGPPGNRERAFVTAKAAGKAGSPKQQDRSHPLRPMRVAARPATDEGGFATAFS